MNSFRFARAALRARPAAMRVPVQRRAYAEAVPDKVRDRPRISSPSPNGMNEQTADFVADQAELDSPPPGTQPTRILFYLRFRE